jgi:hypothetical protein
MIYIKIFFKHGFFTDHFLFIYIPHKPQNYSMLFIPQNNSTHKTILSTKQVYLQNNSTHKTILSTKQFYLQNNSIYKTILSTK